MKVYKVSAKDRLTVQDDSQPTLPNSKVRVRLTHAGITSSDIGIYKGVRKAELPLIPCSMGVGVVSDVGEEVLACKKGDRVVFVPEHACGRCFECKTGEEDKCQNVTVAGISQSGYLQEFVLENEEKLIVLPQRLSDKQAIFARFVDIAIHVCDKLDVTKGENIIIASAGVQALITAQVVSYYQATPILIDNNLKNIEMALSQGYTAFLSKNEDLLLSIKQITGGKMADSLVLYSQHAFDSEKAPDFVKKGGAIGVYQENSLPSVVNVDKLFERNITLYPVKTYGDEMMMSINLLTNGSVSVEGLYRDGGKLSEIHERYQLLSEKFDRGESIKVNIVDMLG